MDKSNKLEKSTDDIEPDSHCCRVHLYIPLRLKAWGLMIIFGGVLAAILYGIIYATSYPVMAAFQNSITLKMHVHTFTLIDRNIEDLSRWSHELLCDGIVVPTLESTDDTRINAFNKTVYNRFYQNNKWFTAHSLNGYVLYDSEANILASDHHRCLGRNATVCNEYASGNSEIPKVFQSKTQFMRDILARTDDEFSGIISVDKTSNANTPIYLFVVRKVFNSNGTTIGMVAMFRDLRLAYPTVESSAQCCVSVWTDLETPPDDVVANRADAVNKSIDLTIRRGDDPMDLLMQNTMLYLEVKDLPESERRVCESSVYESIFLTHAAHVNVQYSYVLPPDPSGTNVVDNETRLNKYGLTGAMLRFDVPRTVRHNWVQFLLELGVMILVMYLFAAISVLFSMEFTVFKPLREAQAIMRKSIESFFKSLRDDDIFDVDEMYLNNQKRKKEMNFAVKDALADSHMLNRDADDITVLVALSEKAAQLREKQLEKLTRTYDKVHGGNEKDGTTLRMLSFLSGRDEEGISLILPGLNKQSIVNSHKEIRSFHQLLSSPVGLMCFKHFCSEKGTDYATSVMFMIDVAYMTASEQGESTEADFISNPAEYDPVDSSPVTGPYTTPPTPTSPVQISKANYMHRSMTYSQLAQINNSPRRSFFPRKHGDGSGEGTPTGSSEGTPQDASKPSAVELPKPSPLELSKPTPLELFRPSPLELSKPLPPVEGARDSPKEHTDNFKPLSALPKDRTRFHMIRSSKSAANLMSAAVTGESSKLFSSLNEEDSTQAQFQMPHLDVTNKGAFKTLLGAKAARMIYILYFDYKRCRRYNVHLIGVSNCPEYTNLIRKVPTNWHPRMFNPVAAAVSKALSEVFAEFRNSNHYYLLMMILTAQQDPSASSSLPSYMRLLWPVMRKAEQEPNPVESSTDQNNRHIHLHTHKDQRHKEPEHESSK